MCQEVLDKFISIDNNHYHFNTLSIVFTIEYTKFAYSKFKYLTLKIRNFHCFQKCIFPINVVTQSKKESSLQPSFQVVFCLTTSTFYC
jgi:hypothetical protein